MMSAPSSAEGGIGGNEILFKDKTLLLKHKEESAQVLPRHVDFSS
jgi:hypothetical protein